MRAFKIRVLYSLIMVSLVLTSLPEITPSATLYATTTSTSSQYKASSLTDIKKIVHSSMVNRQTNLIIKYKGSTKNLLNTISSYIDEIVKTDEYLNYSFRGVNMSYKAYGTDVTITIELKYYETLEQIKYVDQYVAAVLKQIINPTMNDHEIVKAIHDYVVLNLTYDTSLTNNSPYPAIIEGTTACNGYAMLIYKMLKHVGIDVRLISGVASSQEFDVQNHAWNMVKLDGIWYHLDATWNDPVPDEKGRVLYHYYLLSDQQISKDHSWTTGGINGEEMPYPAAQTHYYKTLQAKINNTNEADRYLHLLNELGLNYLLPEYTAANFDELKRQIQNRFADFNKEFSIRFVDTNHTLALNLRQIIYESAVQSGVNSWSYSYIPYYNGTSANDVLITISDIVYLNPSKVERKEVSMINYPVNGYRSMGTFANVDSGKRWTIQLDAPIDVTTIKDDAIYVINSSGHKLQSIKYSMSDSKTITVSNDNAYKSGETYYLFVNQSILGTNGQLLKDAVSIKFTVKK